MTLPKLHMTSSDRIAPKAYLTREKLHRGRHVHWASMKNDGDVRHVNAPTKLNVAATTLLKAVIAVDAS